MKFFSTIQIGITMALAMVPVALAAGSYSTPDQGYCLDIIADNPEEARFFTDFDTTASSLRRFGATFFQKAQKRIAARYGCQSIPTPRFSCYGFNQGSPVCAASTEEHLVVVARDYVDEARLIVWQKSELEDIAFPLVDSQNNTEILYLPNTSNCYRGLLGSRIDSNLFALDIEPWLPSGDTRFLMAQMARSLVDELSDLSSNSVCAYHPIERSITNAECQVLGQTGVESCYLASGGKGYFLYIFARESAEAYMIFNRLD